MLGLGASDFEFGVDPSADPELALVRWGRSGCTHCAGQGTAGGPCGRPAQRRARPRVRRHCASPWRSRGSGKRRRPGGLRPLLQLKLGLQPPAGTVSGWAGGGGMCEGRGAAPAPWEAGAGCGTALHSSAAAGVPCGRQPLPRMLGRARAGASSAAATTPWGLGGGREGFGAAPGGLVLGCESGLCVRRFGRCPAEDDHHPAGVRPRRAARPEQHDGGGADRLRHADVAAGGR